MNLKQYLKEELPKISLGLIIMFFISNILTLYAARIGNAFLLYPSNLYEPLNWYRLLSYPLYVGGGLSWLHNSLVIFLTGYIIESRIQKKDLFVLILLSSIIGGLSFVIFNQGDYHNAPIASPTMISWGYWSMCVIVGLKYWRTLNIFEKIIVILCFASILSLGNDNFGFFIGQLCVIVGIAIFGVIRIKNHKNNLKEKHCLELAVWRNGYLSPLKRNGDKRHHAGECSR